MPPKSKNDTKPVELFHAGPPKTATTWVYHALKSHPQISTSASDRIHYFDMFHAKGVSWYDEQFTSRDPSAAGVKRFDPTYSYICSPRAPERIAAYNPQAKIMVCLRNPVERAFSHYWHIKKQSKDDSICFEDILEHYNNYATWMEHGFIAMGLQRLYDCMPRENIMVMRFEDLKKNPEKVYDEIVDFCGIDKEFRPPVLNKRVNIAGAKKNLAALTMNRVLKRLAGEKKLEEMSRRSPLIGFLSGKGEYLRGMRDDTRAQLYELCRSEIEEIERLTDFDLSSWKDAGQGEQTGRKTG